MGLDLTFLVDAEDKLSSWRREITAEISRSFATNSGSSESLNLWLR